VDISHKLVGRLFTKTPFLFSYRLLGPFHGLFTVIYRGSEGDLCEASTSTSRIWLMPSGPFGCLGRTPLPSFKFQVLEYYSYS
jgi:hypothetical protein